MKILQIVSLVTPDNAYGGPLRVAVNQTRQLRAMGHDVTLVAGARGYTGPLPRTIDGVETRLFRALKAIPGTGFAGVTSPGLLAFVATKANEFDLVHVHLARDLVVAPAALWISLRKVPLVIQAHGMIDESVNPLASIMDKVVLRRCFRSAKAVLWLTEKERQSVARLFGNLLRMDQLYNGVPVVNSIAQKISAKDAPVRVLYLARLQARKRPMSFVRAAQNLLDSGVEADFVLAGPDEGEGREVAQEIQRSGGRIRWIGGVPPEETASVMKAADVYCLPSIHEPFPMSVLESLSIGLPVIITDTCGLSEYVQNAGAGFVVSDKESDLECALRQVITDAVTRGIMAENGRELIRSKFSIDAVGKTLESIYMRA